MRHRVVSFAGVIIQVLLVMAFVRLSWAQGCTQTAKPEITSDLTEGVKDVSGKLGAITVAAGHTCTARIELWLRLVAAGDAKPGDDKLKETVDIHGNQVRALLGTAAATGGQFDIKLSDPLVSGQTLFLTEIITDTQGSTGTDQNPIFSDGVVRVAAFGSWGLVRAYFTSGFLLSQDQGSF